MIRIGARPSPLAARQVREVMKLLTEKRPDLIDKFEIKTYNTMGDRDKTTPVSSVEGTDFFTDTIETALSGGEIDVAVHSAKDLPDVIPGGLQVIAVTESIDRHDALVSKRGWTLDTLPERARIGTSSNRRREQLKKFRDDFEIVGIRGNIGERLMLLEEGSQNLDAVVVAFAAMLRLGLENKISQIIPFEIITPHPLQGSLAVESRSDNKEMIALFSKLDTRKGILRM
ncbi:MAG: hydroxymethylbilane synthase [Elusimicrobiota bacterium]